MIDQEFVILVDEQDQEIGTMEKMEAHEKGVLHRAFSVFIFNSNKELLLQQRAMGKYHSPGKWTNTCCSHQRAGESSLNASKRRLMEEMGFVCGVEEAYRFMYKADVGQGMIEHELDHVFVGQYEGEVPFNVEEVMAYKYMSLEKIEEDLKANPKNYTEWFLITFQDLKKFVESN